MTVVTRRLFAKRNLDGSFSVSYPVGELAEDSFVDFYNEQTGHGFQHNEVSRRKRGRDVAEYIRRCVRDGVEPRLFELTVNARVGGLWGVGENWRYEPLSEEGTVGFLTLAPVAVGKWLSLTDGGTRALGIDIALNRGHLEAEWTVDVRVFLNLSMPQEITQFLLINDYQKKVRTDLGLGVVQRALDEGTLSSEDFRSLQTVVPEADSWRFEASRVAAELNTASDSPWRGRIQVPGGPTRSSTLQSFFTSLAPILNDSDVKSLMDEIGGTGDAGRDRVGFIIRLLKNFWGAVAMVNSRANDEPETNVLWGPVGSSACHIALAAVVKMVLNSSEPDLTSERFVEMLDGSLVVSYEYWFTKMGKNSPNNYPSERGGAAMMIGASNYRRLARELEMSWRSNLDAGRSKRVVRI